MLMIRKRQSGFTIVELLIVVVVIAILAAISSVAYSSLQRRALVSVAKSDLENIGKQMQLFHAENGVYPGTMQTPKDDLANVMKAAGVYEATRFTDSAAWSAGERPPKRFVFCTPEGDTQRFAVVADIPLLSDSFDAVGTTTYYVDQTGSVKEMIFTESYPGAISRSLCVTATGSNPAVWGAWTAWSNSVPSSWAP
jgi:prepilin-type N-terminal cleavage/methylation domain-containing protein